MTNSRIRGVALVTGASSGIGAAIAKRLSQRGFTVYGASRSMRPVDAAVRAIKLNVNDQESVDACIREVLRIEGRIDVLVNNAGYTMEGATEETSIDQAKALFETNFFGVMRMTLAVLPIMRKQGVGRILHTGSVHGFLPAPYSGVYSASKHAIEGFSETLDHEVRNLNIRSIVIEPGYTASAIMENTVEGDRPLKAYALARAHMSKTIEGAMSSAVSTEIVADVVEKALSAKRPKVRYPAGKPAETLAILRRFIPASVFEKSFRKQFGMDLVGATPTVGE